MWPKCYGLIFSAKIQPVSEVLCLVIDISTVRVLVLEQVSVHHFSQILRKAFLAFDYFDNIDLEEIISMPHDVPIQNPRLITYYG